MVGGIVGVGWWVGWGLDGGWDGSGGWRPTWDKNRTKILWGPSTLPARYGRQSDVELQVDCLFRILNPRVGQKLNMRKLLAGHNQTAIFDLDV